MKSARTLLVAVALSMAGLDLAGAAEYRVGTAAAEITPELPFWLTGFAARTRPADKVTAPIFAKALAVSDVRGHRVVIITADLLGVTREITTEVAARLASKHQLRRSEILFNASHTHSGPSVWPRLHIAPVTSPEVEKQIETYGRRLVDTFTRLATEALASMGPAEIRFGVIEGQVQFAKNRRVAALARVRPGFTPPAPVDHSVPVWQFVDPTDGTVRAILFGYACHNTVLTSQFTEVNGDYAGYAQAALERTFPRAKALFLALCAGDQGAEPRGTTEHARRYGEALSEAVTRAKLRPLRGPVRTAYEEILLPFQVHTREHYAAEAASADVFAARRGKTMLAAYDARRPIVDTPFPVAAVRFGDDSGLLALGGEVVIDYALRLKAEYGAGTLAVAAYSNDVMGYIPSVRILREGGYEAGDSMMYYIQPGWFTEEVERLVLDAARRTLAAVELKPRRSR